MSLYGDVLTGVHEGQSVGETQRSQNILADRHSLPSFKSDNNTPQSSNYTLFNSRLRSRESVFVYNFTVINTTPV